MTYFHWLTSLPPGSLVAISDGETETVGIAAGPLGFDPTRIELRGEVRNWAIENEIPCSEAPGGGGYALIPDTEDQDFAIRLRWH